MTNEERAVGAADGATVEAFQRDGACVVRGLLSDDEVALLREGIEAVLADPSPRYLVASRPDDPGWFFEDFCNWQRIEPLRHLALDSPLGALGKRLMRSETARVHHDHVLVKEPGTRQRTPWHQDQPYYDIEGMDNVSLWIPVDPVSRTATLEFVAGSHRGPWLMPRTFMDNNAKWFPEGSLEDIPDIEADRDAFPILGWELEPGDMVCFHMLTLHASGGVEGTARRRAFSLRLLGDDARYAPRQWKTSPSFPGLADELAAGAAFEHPLFPLVA